MALGGILTSISSFDVIFGKDLYDIVEATSKGAVVYYQGPWQGSENFDLHFQKKKLNPPLVTIKKVQPPYKGWWLGCISKVMIGGLQATIKVALYEGGSGVLPCHKIC